MLTRARIVALVAGVAMTGAVFAQDKPSKTINPAPAKPTTAQPTEKAPAGNDPIAAWKAANEPGKEHTELTVHLIGNWKIEATAWMAPGAEPMKSTGESSIRGVMKGRVFREEYSGEWGGEKFQGEGLFSYNNGSKKYECTWVDSMTTGIMYMSGTKTADGSLEFKGECTDPLSGQHKMVRSVLKFDGADKHTFTMYETSSGGTEFKSMEMTYTRTTPAKPVKAEPINTPAKPEPTKRSQ